MRDFDPVDHPGSNDSGPTPRFFRWVLVVLPAGLVLLTAISFVFWYQRKQAEENPGARAGASEVALAKPVDAEELHALADRLESAIGPRPAGDRDAVRRTLNYLESTLGPRNMGFNVARERIGGSGDEGVELLVAVVEGDAARGGVVLVAAPFTTGIGDAAPGAAEVRRGSEAVAALVTVANAWVGTRNRRPIVFLLHPGDGPPPDELAQRILETPVFASIDVTAWLERFAPAGDEGASDPDALVEAARRLDRELDGLVGG